jgi:hypothetical protein
LSRRAVLQHDRNVLLAFRKAKRQVLLTRHRGPNRNA